MRRSFARIKGIGFLLWHGKHMLIHIFLGVLWVWILREFWGMLDVRWIYLAAFGSWLPDIDHLLYFATYGRDDPYTQSILSFIRTRKWRVLVKYIETGHKYNTNLQFHNVYTLGLIMAFCILSFFYDYRLGVVLFGSMVTHYFYDMTEDVLVLGYLNNNWERMGHDDAEVSAPSVPKSP